MNVNSFRPLLWMQILLLVFAAVPGEGQIPVAHSYTQTQSPLSFRVSDIECLTVDTSIVGWNSGDQVCVHTVDEKAPDSISHFVSVRTEGETTNYFLVEPEYTEFQLGSDGTYPSISYLLISLDENRVGVGSVEFVFKTVRDMENFNIFFITGLLPTRKAFMTEFVGNQ